MELTYSETVVVVPDNWILEQCGRYGRDWDSRRKCPAGQICTGSLPDYPDCRRTIPERTGATIRVDCEYKEGYEVIYGWTTSRLVPVQR